MMTRARRRWLFSQLRKAFSVGVFGLILSYSALAMGFFLIFNWWSFESYWAWATGLGLGLVWLLLLFFGAGPITLLLASFYLSNRANWKLLSEVSGQVFEEGLPRRKVSFWMSFLLFLALVLAIPFGFFPLLIWLNFLITSYILAQEWIWATEENFGIRPRSFFYKLGLGLVPAICAIIPILGVLILPFLQIASLWNYRKES